MLELRNWRLATEDSKLLTNDDYYDSGEDTKLENYWFSMPDFKQGQLDKFKLLT